jgi:DNA ligase-1
MKIKSIEKLSKSYDKYDLEISDNHNFFANEILVHNCRCIARKDGLWSRNGKKFASVPHIEEALKPIFELYPTLILDGELYCDKFSNDFNAICSLVKKTKPTEQDLKDSAASIQYWIYDTITNTSFEDRSAKVYDIVHALNHHSIKAVPTIDIFTFKDIDAWYGKYIDDGFEGQMVRTNGPYENKRSKNLLKRKEFQDKEYTILDVIEGDGNRSGGAGAMTFENEQGIRFNSNIKGTREYCAQLLREKDELIGKQATIKFFNLTPDNIPRFPFIIGIRNYE